MDYIPSYDNYREILRAAKKTKKIMLFRDVRPTDRQFIVIRHDIEFDIDKALALAIIEHKMNVQSTYLVQIGSQAYNAFSDDNIEKLEKIIELGHDVGLHYRQIGLDSASERDEIKSQLGILKSMINGAVDVFGCHRPRAGTPYNEYRLHGAVNTYQEPFFYKTSNPAGAKTRYISDSKWRWNYGDPVAKTFEECKRVQLLTHPFQWSENGLGMSETFERIELFHRAELIETFAREYERYEEC